ncbi:hypothetical protein HGA11_30110 [Mycolicibacterium septicum DSM 44393]|uniref:Beta-lactamase n=1 Tax=Mycolicibacterium septicum DSM 44393 TaxID=1341646 RepID=A0A7X6RZ63_9MYCO|nr:hypothetical protein [Mycolicibacterium septicum]NKZ15234.1 hypothetical protein [Mycolicibacterium septicum DSM 44393]
MTSIRRGRLWTLIAVFAVIALAAGVVIGTQLGSRETAPKRSTAATSLAAEFAQLQPQLHAVVGIALSGVGPGQQPMTFGEWQSGPAWSTIKVPLIIAALREEEPPRVTEAMTAAITESDNAAAESIWESLGTPADAAGKVEAVLRQAGDPTIVQSQRVRPEFSASGQTDWPLADQVKFTSVAVCDNENDPVFDLMGRVESDQRWGIGMIADSRLKGGWGPSPTGGYLVRQIGVLTTPTGRVSVALAALPNSGKFEDGTATLTTMANWLSQRLGALPAGHCPAHQR